MRMFMAVPVLVGLGALGGCVKHIGSYEPKQREYQLPKGVGDQTGDRTPGSLFNTGQFSSYLFSDQRALMINDVVTVRIKEESSAFSNATTKLDSESDVQMGVDAMMGFLAALQQSNPNFDRSKIIGAGMKNGYTGSGATTRRGQVKAVVPAIVRQVSDSGNLFIEGHRVILVNDEEYHFYISGVVRSIDIDETNGVDSFKIADAEIEFTGRGTISEKQEPGWFARALDWAWPF